MPYKYRDIWHQKMRAWKQELIRRQRSQETINSYMRTIHHLWIVLGKPDNPLDLSIKEIQTLEMDLVSQGLKENTISTYMRFLRVFLQFSGYKNANQIYIHAKVIPKEDRVFLTESQIDHIREVAHKLGPKYELVFSLGVDNGLRRGDICHIAYQEARALLFTRQAYITQKGKRRRPLIIHTSTLEPLRQYLNERKEILKRHGMPENQNNLFICSTTGKKVGVQAIGYWVVALSDASGIFFRCHDLRATFVRRHARVNTTPDVVMSLTGHASWDTAFKHYYGQDVDRMRDAQDRI